MIWFLRSCRRYSIVLLIVAAGCAIDRAPAPRIADGLPAAGTVVPSSRSAQYADAASRLPRFPLAVPRDSRYAVAIESGLLWLVTSGDRRISTVDLSSGAPSGPAITLDFAPVSVAASEGAVWVVGLDHRQVVRIDPATRQIVATIDIGAVQFPAYEHLWIAAGEGFVWLIGQRHVVQIDPRTNQRVGQPIVAGEEVIAFALGAGSLWTGSHDDGVLARIDPATTAVATRIAMDFSIHGLAFADGAAWVLDEHGFGVVRVDAETNRLDARVPIDFVASNLAAGGGSVWVAAAAHNNGRTGMDWVDRIETRALRVAQRIRVGGATDSDYYQALYQDGAPWAVVSTPDPYLIRLVE